MPKSPIHQRLPRNLRLPLVFASAAILTAASAVQSHVTIDRLRADSEWSDRSRETHESIYQLSELMAVSQNHSRAYFMTGQAYHADRRNDAFQRAIRAADRLRWAATDTPSQKAHLDKIEEILVARQRKWDELRLLKAEKGLGAVQGWMRGPDGKARDERLTHSLRAMIDEQSRLLKERLRSSQARASRDQAWALAAQLLAAMVLMGAAIFTGRRLGARRSGARKPELAKPAKAAPSTRSAA